MTHYLEFEKQLAEIEGKAGEVSSLIAYLDSPDAAYLTGQNIRIDGGLTASA